MVGENSPPLPSCFVSAPLCQLGKWRPFSPPGSPSPGRKGWKSPCTCLRVAASSSSLQEGAGLLLSADQGTAPLTVFAEVAAAGDRRDRLSCTYLAGEPRWAALDSHSTFQSIIYLRTLRNETDTDQPQSTCWLSQSMDAIAIALF